MHSALEVGLLRAKITGLSLKEAMDLTISSVNAPATAATPDEDQRRQALITLCSYVGVGPKVSGLLMVCPGGWSPHMESPQYNAM